MDRKKKKKNIEREEYYTMNAEKWKRERKLKKMKN